MNTDKERNYTSETIELFQTAARPEWSNDDFSLAGKIVGVEVVDNNWNRIHELPLTMRGATIGELKKNIKVLCLQGGACWPGKIDPIAPGQIYGIKFWTDGRDDDCEWLAAVGRMDATLTTDPATAGRV